MNEKVFIVVSKGKYHKSVKNGVEFTSVGFNARGYGASGPYDSPDEVHNAIRLCKKWIREKGDIPVVDNKVEKRNLTEWF